MKTISGNIKILSCNIRDARANDGANNWQFRKTACIELLRRQQADILCFQEMRFDQQQDLLAALPEFHCIGLPEAPPAQDMPNAIFFRHSTFELLDHGGYWLSETPAIANSRSWNSQYTRLANWVYLHHIASGQRLRVTNTHLEDDNTYAAEQQAQVITRTTTPASDDELQVLTGDMNNDANSAALQEFFRHGWHDTHFAIHNTYNCGRTFHAFAGENYQGEPSGKIDWILARNTKPVIAAEILREKTGSHYPSDHYFISATFALTATTASHKTTPEQGEQHEQ